MTHKRETVKSLVSRKHPGVETAFYVDWNTLFERRVKIMDVAEWQRRLENYFKVDGGTDDALMQVLNQEFAYGRYVVVRFHGQFVLMDSFFSFFIETVDKAVKIDSSKAWPYAEYPFVLLYYTTIFRSFRAAENLLKSGYPLDGYALLRDLKDRAIFLGALAHGKTSFSKLLGVEKGKSVTSIREEESRRIKSRRKDEERRILDEMIRKKSGLPNDVEKELATWENLFHEEVHGSKLTFAQDIDWPTGKQPLILGPIPHDRPIAVYINRASEIGWMILRTFPFLQHEPRAFGKEWRKKWMVLDDSFRFAIESLEKMGKKIAPAIRALIDTKFMFPEDFHYHE